LFICPGHNSKTNYPKVFKLGVENDLRYPISYMVSGLKGHSAFFTLIRLY